MAEEILCAECGRPVGDRLALCTYCGARLVAELLSVPGVLADLTTTRTGQGRLSSQRAGGRSAEMPLPIQSAARGMKDPVGTELRGDRAYDRLVVTLAGWARVLAEHLAVEIPIGARGLQQLAINGRRQPADLETIPSRSPNGKFVRTIRRHPDALTSPATPIEQAAVWMACHPHELRAHEAAHEMLTEITGALEQVRRIVDRPVELNYLGPCSTELPGGMDCGFVLRAERGETYVRCGRCRMQFAVADLQARAREIAEDRLYTISELGNVLAAVGTAVPRRTLYWWASERKIAPRGWMHEDQRGRRITDHKIGDNDRQVYRLGDVLTLAHRDLKEGGSAA